MPEWAYALQPADFERVAQEAWLPRWAARILEKEDREDGGSPVVIKAEFRRCEVCGRLNIQTGAHDMRLRNAKGFATCGFGCAGRMWAQKERRRALMRSRRAMGE